MTLTTAVLGRDGMVLSESEEARPAGLLMEGECPGDAIAGLATFYIKVRVQESLMVESAWRSNNKKSSGKSDCSKSLFQMHGMTVSKL